MKAGTKEPLRVASALALGVFASAVALAVLLILLANLDSGLPLATDLSVLRIFMMSVAFCLFTVPITFSVGVPLYLLFRHFDLLHVWICTITGGVIALGFPYGFRLLGFGVSLPWQAIFWFAMSGAAGGAVMGALVRPRKANFEDTISGMRR
jgi:hypothetical protein